MTRSIFLLYTLLMLLSAGFVQELGPIWIEEIAGPQSNRPATLLTFLFLCEIPFFFLLPHIEAAFNFFGTLCLTFLLMIAGLALLTFPTHQTWTYDTGWMIGGILSAAFSILGTNLLQSNINPARRGFYQTLLSTAMGIGNGLVPTLLLYAKPTTLSIGMIIAVLGLLMGAVVFLRLLHPNFLKNARPLTTETSLKKKVQNHLNLLRHPILITYVLLYQLNNTLPNFIIMIGKEEHWTNRHDLYTTDIVMMSFIFLVPLGLLADRIGLYRTTMMAALVLALLNTIGLVWPATWGHVATLYGGINLLDLLVQALLYAYIAKVFPHSMVLTVLATSQVLSATFGALFNEILGSSLAHYGFEFTQTITLVFNVLCLISFLLGRKNYDEIEQIATTRLLQRKPKS